MLLREKTYTLRELLGDELMSQTGQDRLEGVPTALTKITGPTYTLTDIIASGRSPSSTVDDGPIPRQHLHAILSYLFPNKDSKYKYDDSIGGHIEIKSPKFQNYKLLMSGIKSSPIDGIVWRLSLILIHLNNSIGIKAVAHLYHEFMSEIRYRWDNSNEIPGIPDCDGVIDHTYNLFHQKLQMLNCCIKHKNTKMEKYLQHPQRQSEDDEDDEDEFFECNEESFNKLEVWNSKPDGRLKRFYKNKLLQNESEFIYIPITQDPSPMTEDLLAEQAELMLTLGFDEEGSALRARMQSASLLSDMESFKAANPGAILEDFVRWHSPRDWDDNKRELSSRMSLANNIWHEVWGNAKPVPARRQKRLFDETKEAGKVLTYLSGFHVGQIVDLLLPNIFHCSLIRIMDEGHFEKIPHVSDIINESLNKLGKASRYQCPTEIKHIKQIDDVNEKEFDKRTNLYKHIQRLVNLAEMKLSLAYSLQTKFLKDLNSYKEEEDQEQYIQMNEFVDKLYGNQQHEIGVIGASRGPAGTLLQKMFKAAQRESLMSYDDDVPTFPTPIAKEFILRTLCPRPYKSSKSSPQQMYCCLKSNELRISGAFTIDKSFP